MICEIGHGVLLYVAMVDLWHHAIIYTMPYWLGWISNLGGQEGLHDSDPRQLQACEKSFKHVFA